MRIRSYWTCHDTYRYAYATLRCEFRLHACNYASAIDTYRYSTVNNYFLPTLATPLQNCAAAAHAPAPPAAMRAVTPSELATKGNAAGAAVAVAVAAGSDPVAGPLSALSSFDSVWRESLLLVALSASSSGSSNCLPYNYNHIMHIS